MHQANIPAGQLFLKNVVKQVETGWHISEERNKIKLATKKKGKLILALHHRGL